jgi:hypothetical protein
MLVVCTPRIGTLAGRRKLREVNAVVNNGDVGRQSESFLEREIFIACRDTYDFVGPTEQEPVDRAMQVANAKPVIVKIVDSMIGVNRADIPHPSRSDSTVESRHATMSVDQLRARGSNRSHHVGYAAHGRRLRYAHRVMRDALPMELVYKLARCRARDRRVQPAPGQSFGNVQDVALAPAQDRLVNGEQDRRTHAR